MIVSHGFDGLSMQKLAKAARLSPSTIYVYFKSREDLLNQLYLDVEQRFEEKAMKGFDPAMPFVEGLWLQWLNRYEHIQQNQLEFYFSEQFRNSPLIKRNLASQSAFREAMNEFVANAVKNKELIDLPIEIFWAVAYGAFYILVKFYLNQSTMSGKAFHLSESKLRQAFELVMKSLKP